MVKMNELGKRPPRSVSSFIRRALAPVLLSFEDLTGLDRPLWRDYSYWDGSVDMAVAKANGVLGMISRSSISWGYVDPTWAINWQRAGEVGLYRTSFHVIYPDQPLFHSLGADGRILSRGQVDHWFEVHPELDAAPMRIPRAIDLEISRDQSSQKIADITWAMIEAVEARDGIKPILYTNARRLNPASGVDAWLTSWTSEMVNSLYWWLPQYLPDRVREHPDPWIPPILEKERVVLHQTADMKPGFPGEAESLSVDYNRWEQGDAVDMVTFIEEVWNEAYIPPRPPTEVSFDDLRNRMNECDALIEKLARLYGDEPVPDPDPEPEPVDYDLATIRNWADVPAEKRPATIDGRPVAYFRVTEEVPLLVISGYNNAEKPGAIWDESESTIFAGEGNTRGMRTHAFPPRILQVFADGGHYERSTVPVEVTKGDGDNHGLQLTPYQWSDGKDLRIHPHSGELYILLAHVEIVR